MQKNGGRSAHQLRSFCFRPCSGAATCLPPQLEGNTANSIDDDPCTACTSVSVLHNCRRCILAVMPRQRAVLRGPHTLALELGDDLIPGNDELLIQPDIVGICGTDLELWSGNMPYLATGFSRYPIVPGHEWTGIVVDAAAAERQLVGCRVVGECTVSCRQCDRCLSGSYHLCEQRTETGIARRDGAMQTQMAMPANAVHIVARYCCGRRRGAY